MKQKPDRLEQPFPLSLESALEAWSQANKLTSDLPESQTFSRSELITEVNRRLPAGCTKVTKQKIETRQDNEVLHQISNDTSKERIWWHYPVYDVQINLFIELLQARYPQDKISYPTLKKLLSDIESVRNPDLSTPLKSARTVLQNRMLGILLTILGDEEGGNPPKECVIGLNMVQKSSTYTESGYLNDIHQVRQILGTGSWHIAVGDERSKLYLYASLEDAVKRRKEVLGELTGHSWYRIVIIDNNEGQLYQIVVGLSRRYEYLTENRQLGQALENLCRNKLMIQINRYAGLSLLLKMAFSSLPKTDAGTPLSAMCDILSSASDSWDDAAILLPRSEQSGTSMDGGLILKHYSADFLQGQIGSDPTVVISSVMDWRRVYQSGSIIEPVVEHDPRLLFHHQPAAAAIIPIVSSGEEVQGLLYVVRRRPPTDTEIVFTEEMLAALYAMGRICGDQTLRDKIELYTVSTVGRRFVEGLHAAPVETFDTTLQLAKRILDFFKLNLPIERLSQYWIYLVTFTAWYQASEEQRNQILSRSFSEQAVLFVEGYLSTKLREATRVEKLPIGRLRLNSDESQYVFPILAPISLPENVFKEKMRSLQEELEPLGKHLVDADVFIWGITLPFQGLLETLKSTASLEGRVEGNSEKLARIIEGAVNAGPYINSGHRELRNGNLDQAINKFEQAQRTSPWNYYVHKHLGEVRMLQGKYEDAEGHCREAIRLNPRYASALCLLADLLVYQGLFAEAFVHYEQAVRYSTQDQRSACLVRYGIALANIPKKVYDDAIPKMKDFDKTILEANFRGDPSLDAIERFDQAERLYEKMIQGGGRSNKFGASYHYHRGMAFFRSRKYQKATEEFSLGRKLEPDNTILGDALSHALIYQHSDGESEKVFHEANK